MLVAVVGIVSALIFGFADFTGGAASRKSMSILVTGVSAFTGVILIGLTTLITGGVWSSHAVIWGGLSGAIGCLAIALLYACLAIGPMSILSPLTAVVSAVVPLLVGLASGESFEIWGYLGLGLALVAIVLVGFVPEKGAVRPTIRGVTMAVGSGVLIGIFLVVFSWTPSEALLIPLFFNRAVNALIMLGCVALLVILRKTERPLALGGLKLAIGAGAIDSVANALLLWGIQIGDLSVMGVLSALYPAGTVILAATILKERIAPVQWLGLALALSGTILLALN